MGRIGFFEHKGKRMLSLNLTLAPGVADEEIYAAMDEAKRLIAKEPPGSVLTVTDVTGGHFDSKMAEAFKAFTAHNKPYVKAAAVVGVTGMLKVLYMAVTKFSGRQIQMFDNLGAAKDWLAAKG